MVLKSIVISLSRASSPKYDTFLVVAVLPPHKANHIIGDGFMVLSETTSRFVQQCSSRQVYLYKIIDAGYRFNWCQLRGSGVSCLSFGPLLARINISSARPTLK